MVFDVEREGEGGEGFVVIGEGQHLAALFFVHFSFVHDAGSPHQRVVKTAAYTAAALNPDSFSGNVTGW